MYESKLHWIEQVIKVSYINQSYIYLTLPEQWLSSLSPPNLQNANMKKLLVHLNCLLHEKYYFLNQKPFKK